jgi:hypothetical protein
MADAVTGSTARQHLVARLRARRPSPCRATREGNQPDGCGEIARVARRFRRAAGISGPKEEPDVKPAEF